MPKPSPVEIGKLETEVTQRGSDPPKRKDMHHSDYGVQNVPSQSTKRLGKPDRVPRRTDAAGFSRVAESLSD